jgi:hypothetical protein
MLMLMHYSKPGAETRDSQEDDDSYWDQYDQITGRPTLGQATGTADMPEEVEYDSSGYFDQYDNVDSLVGDSSKLVPESSRGTVGNPTDTQPLNRLTEISTDIGLDQFIRNSVRNMWELAKRCEMSKAQFLEIIRESLY